MIDKENLLQEAQSWTPDKVINWSELARDYGLHPTAIIHLQGRCKERLNTSTCTTMPMYPTVLHEKAKLEDHISKGEIIIWDEVVPTTVYAEIRHMSAKLSLRYRPRRSERFYLLKV